jgi:hypothetical protein
MSLFIILLSWSFFFLFFLKISKYQNKFVFFNASLLVFFCFLLYYSIPVFFNTYLSDFYGEYYRLRILDISDSENFYVSLNILSGSFGFLLSCIFIKFNHITEKSYKKNKFFIIAIIFYLIVLSLSNTYLFNLNTSSISSRLESYLFARELNFSDRVLNKFYVVTIVYLEIILVFKIFQYFSSNTKIIWAFIFVYLLNLYFNFDINDQRSELFKILTISLIAYHLYIKKFSILKMFFFASLSIFIFTSWSAAREGNLFFDISAIKNLGEFDMIYANVIELYRNPPKNILITAKLYDFYGFIPSTFLPFEKITQWGLFMENYHPTYYSLGGGYGYGILSESVYGFGIVETFFKTFVLSCFLNYAFKKYLNSNSEYVEIFYIILFITSPTAIRITTFFFLSDVIQFGAIISIMLLLFSNFFKKNKKI